MIGSPLSPSPPRHRRRPCHRSDSRRARRVPAGRGAATAPPGDDCAAWVRCEGVTRIRVRSNAPKSPPGGAVAPTPTLQPPGPSPAAQRRGRESRQGVRRHIRREARAAAALRRVPASVCFLLSLRQSSHRDRPGRQGVVSAAALGPSPGRAEFRVLFYLAFDPRHWYASGVSE